MPVIKAKSFGEQPKLRSLAFWKTNDVALNRRIEMPPAIHFPEAIEKQPESIPDNNQKSSGETNKSAVVTNTDIAKEEREEPKEAPTDNNIVRSCKKAT